MFYIFVKFDQYFSFFINLFISINHDNGSGASIWDYENDASVLVLFLSISAEIN